MVYANHAGSSWPKPDPVCAAVATAFETPPEQWPEHLDAQHREVASAFGLSDSARLLLTPGATSALATAVASLPWAAGDRVIVSGLEHHALNGPVQALTARGVERVVVPAGDGGPVALGALEAELQQGRVRLVAMTAASNVTGELLPIERIVGLARQHGALSLIDGAQLAGWHPLDLPALGADLFAFAGHKGPQAPWGVGGLYVAPHLPMPGYCDVGSIDRAALAGLAAGLRWLAAPERAERLERARAGVAAIAAGVADLPGITFHGAAKSRVPTLALTAAGVGAAAFGAELAARGVIASGGLQCAPLAHETLGTLPDGVLRISLGPATTAEEVDWIVGALRECVRA